MIAGFVLLIVVTLYRLLPIFLGATTVQPSFLPGFSPIAAMMLCGAAFLPRRIAIAVPFAALLVTDVALNVHYGSPAFSVAMLVNVFAFASISALGWKLRANAGARTMLPAAIGSAFFFYLVSNTGAWLMSDSYATSLAGWVQALTTGVPGFAPTWTFLRNELISNVLFTGLFLACMHRSDPPAPVRAPARW